MTGHHHVYSSKIQSRIVFLDGSLPGSYQHYFEYIQYMCNAVYSICIPEMGF